MSEQVQESALHRRRWLIMTVVSSLFAIRRLWKVDPIMLFE